MRLPDYAAARRYLEQYAPPPGQFTPPDLALARTVALMHALDDPQEARPVIHLAGTSGKGSTATLLAAILTAHGLRTGLGLSPHVRSLTERIQLDGAAIDPTRFTAAVAAVQPAVEAVSNGPYGPPSFFEITIALSYLIFAGRVPGCAPVDVVVMETGLGGRTDATNVVRHRDKIALFTAIGLDHTEVLGDSLAPIAREKAGIIQPGNTVISTHQQTVVETVLQEVCQSQAAALTWFDPATQIRRVRPSLTQVTFDFVWHGRPAAADTTWRDLTLSLGGAHQAANAGLALVAARHLLTRQRRGLDAQAARAAFEAVAIPGRTDLQHIGDQPVLLDGAHNPQKMEALVNTLAAAYPATRFCFILALKEGKDIDAVVLRLLPQAAHIVVTAFDNRDQGMHVQAMQPERLAARLSALGYTDFEVTAQMDAALHAARRWNATHAAATPIVITGSLYLLAEAYAAVEKAQQSQREN